LRLAVSLAETVYATKEKGFWNWNVAVPFEYISKWHFPPRRPAETPERAYF
jgi:hypothetical protein